MPVRIAGQKTSDIPGSEKQLGLEAFHAKRWKDAAAHLEKSFADDPEDVVVLNALALACAETGDAKKGRTLLGQALNIAPNCATTYHNMAVLLANGGRILEAADNICRAAELNPSDTNTEKILKDIRSLVRSLKPVKKGKTGHGSQGPTQAEIDARLSRLNSALAGISTAPTGNKPRISLCMITRDEEVLLGRCLDSVKHIVDEIIILDTGSTDRTVEIANTFGAAVHRTKWKDNFSEVRNKAQTYATGDWILVLDADEQLDSGSEKSLLDAVQNPTADGYNLLFHNYLSDGENPDVFVHQVCRLYRNRPNYRFHGRVHEIVASSIVDSGGMLKQLDVVVHHYGYRPDMMESRGKHERYVRLLNAEVEQNPDDPYWLYNLGVAYQTAGNPEKAIEYLQRGIEHVLPEHESAPRLFASFANALCLSGRPEDALEAIASADRVGLRSPELSYCRGSAFLSLKRCEEAISAFSEAITIGQHGRWIGETGAFGYKALFGIASAYVELGDYTKALEFGEKAVQQKPDDVGVHELLASIYLRQGLPERAEEHLSQLAMLDKEVEKTVRNREGHRKENAGTLVELGRTHASDGRVVEALECFARAAAADPTHAESYFGAGDVLYSLGDYHQAAELYQSGLLHKPDNAAGFFIIGNCYRQIGANEAAVLAYRQALTLNPGHTEAQKALDQSLQAAH